MKITSIHLAALAFRKKIRLDVEELWVIALNSQLSILDLDMIFRGTVHSCPSHPRDIARFVCLKNASFFMMAHSHPSGDPNPSREDIKITKQLIRVSHLIEIPLLDHLIISKNGFTSLAQRDFFKKSRHETQPTIQRSTTPNLEP